MTKFDPNLHHRRSIRLKGFDYSQADGYFVTMVTWQREFLFGKIVNGETPDVGAVKLNQRGKIADECWLAIPEHFPHVELGAYVIMPNHVHGIIVINDIDVGATHASPLHAHLHGAPPGSLGAIIGSFKSAVTKRIGRELNETGIWQRNYYEHIIRDEKDLKNKSDYIESNPLLWDEDDENPVNRKK